MVTPAVRLLQTAIAVPSAATCTLTGSTPPEAVLSTVRCHVTGPGPQRSRTASWPWKIVPSSTFPDASAPTNGGIPR